MCARQQLENSLMEALLNTRKLLHFLLNRHTTLKPPSWFLLAP